MAMGLWFQRRIGREIGYPGMRSTPLPYHPRVWSIVPPDLAGYIPCLHHGGPFEWKLPFSIQDDRITATREYISLSSQPAVAEFHGLIQGDGLVEIGINAGSSAHSIRPITAPTPAGWMATE